MEPDYRFGKPYIKGIGYETETLINAVRIEGSVERVSRIYHVDQSAIRCDLISNAS